tara:strand:+ start:5060 stop:5581 length:522 start_codon:yes stop_codon:yes gene_type:complete
MTKFNSNILKIKLFYLNVIGKIKKNNFIINTNNANKTNQSILIIFPVNQIEFDVAKYSFRNLLLNSNNNYIYLINNTYYSNSHFMGTTYGFNYFKNKIVVNSNFYSDKIIDEKIDIVIDLNSSFFLDLAMIVNKIKSNYKICLKNDYSDWFYNLQFECDTLEYGYNKINSMLD